MDSKLKEFIECPSCKTGKIVHVGSNYFCNSKTCNFMIPRIIYGSTITKSKMISLVRNKFIEPMLIGLDVFKGNKTVNGFITLSNYNKVEFSYPKYLPVSRCPKCINNQIIMRYSSFNDSLFYACTDYKLCKFTIPYIFREKPFTFKNIKRICEFDKITKEYTSKNNKKYTVNVFLDRKDLKIKTEM